MDTNSMDLVKYFEYKNFLHECRNKKYPPDLVLHRHHIVPISHVKDTTAEFNIDDSKNLVMLSVEDHITAHIMFSDCFDEGSKQSTDNLKAARVLKKKSIILTREMEELINRAYKRENNPFWGKTHSEENKEKTRQRNIVLRKGKSYEEIYSEEHSEAEKEKRSQGVKKDWENMTEEEKQKRVEAISKSVLSLPKEERIARARHAACANKPWLVINGIRFLSMVDAEKHFNMTAHFIRKNFTIEKVEK